VYRDEEQAQPVKTSQPAEAAPSATPPPASSSQPTPAQSTTPSAPQLHFEPSNLALKNGDTATLALTVSNVSDLYSIPLLIHFNPAVIQVEEVRNGGFLSGGLQEIAIVQRIDSTRGDVIVSATRQPNTPGVSGNGTLIGIVVHAVGLGTSPLQILQVNAHDSQQRSIPMVSGEATIQVQ
jgi:general secretion pathway protein D